MAQLAARQTKCASDLMKYRISKSIHRSRRPSITPSRGISDPYSDIETDLEQSTRRRGRVTPLRKSKKASPTKPKLVQYGGAATGSKAKSSSNNSTPKAIANSAPFITPRPARATNGDAILPGKTRQYDSASVDNGGIAELEQENTVSMSKAKIKAEAAARRKAAAAQKLKVKQLAAKEAEAAEAKAKLERGSVLAEEAAYKL
ncbi:hypothetical protein VE03_10741 [Pseudogymnoascus sp. 23342-1-I1]|nr:hypothetical protein VE03_10741 [Pseudogymnoascus sp. 23342-1-I1]